jgi:ABC-type antimicrobial peptide transport system permease subunit
MNAQLVSLFVLVALSLVAGGIALGASILYRSTTLSRELATRRVMGARRSQIARMLLAENMLGIAAGLAVGAVAAMLAGGLRHPWLLAGLLTSIGLVAVAVFSGGWIAARHAAQVPFGKSGLFRTSSDVRGQQ